MLTRLKDIWSFLAKVPTWAWGVIAAFWVGASWRSRAEANRRAEARSTQARVESDRADKDRQIHAQADDAEMEHREKHAQADDALTQQEKALQSVTNLNDLADFVNDSFDD